MKDESFDESFWFNHKEGYRLYPWYRDSETRGQRAFWVSDGSNLIEDADPFQSVEDLIREVFGRKRAVWLRRRTTSLPGGLYQLDKRSIRGWGAATAEVELLVNAAQGNAGQLANEPMKKQSAHSMRGVSPVALVAAMDAALVVS